MLLLCSAAVVVGLFGCSVVAFVAAFVASGAFLKRDKLLFADAAAVVVVVAVLLLLLLLLLLLVLLMLLLPLKCRNLNIVECTFGYRWPFILR